MKSKNSNAEKLLLAYMAGSEKKKNKNEKVKAKTIPDARKLRIQ